MVHNVKAIPKLWMGYFLVSIFAIGMPLSVGLYIPLFFIGLVWPGSQSWADAIMQWGIGWLMRVQPWFQSSFDLNIPSGGVLLVSNHRSHLDVFCLLSRIPGIRILSKASLLWIPFLNIMMLVSRQIPSRRGRVDSFWKAMQEIQERLSQGETVHVFPEMTRCVSGFQGTQSFLVAPFLAARNANVPVVPMVIEGTDLVWPRGSFSLNPYQSVRLRTLAPLWPKDFPSAEALRDAARAQIEGSLQ